MASQLYILLFFLISVLANRGKAQNVSVVPLPPNQAPLSQENNDNIKLIASDKQMHDNAASEIVDMGNAYLENEHAGLQYDMVERLKNATNHQFVTIDGDSSYVKTDSGNPKAQASIMEIKKYLQLLKAEGNYEDEAKADVVAVDSNAGIDDLIKKWKKGPLQFPECIDATSRGYDAPFVCCSIKDGNWNDSAIWDCNRIPSKFDSVFVRHRVQFITEPRVDVRSLLIIQSKDPKYKGQKGILQANEPDFVNCKHATQESNQIMYKNTMEKLLKVNNHDLYDLQKVCNIKSSPEVHTIHINRIDTIVEAEEAIKIALSPLLKNQTTTDTAYTTERNFNYISSLNAYIQRFEDFNSRVLQAENKLISAPTQSISIQDLKVTGPITFHVEQDCGALFFNGISIVMHGVVQNQGFMYVGEVYSHDCARNLENESSVICSYPGIITGHALIAEQPIYVHWLFFTDLYVLLNSENIIWSGRIGYPDHLPNASTSRLNFSGNIVVDVMSPTFLLHFKRLGFLPLSQNSIDTHNTLRLRSGESAELHIDIDEFDTDGYKECCRSYYDQEVVEWDVGPIKLFFNRYSDYTKTIGDVQDDISDQLLIRAATIYIQEKFLNFPPQIPQENAFLIKNTALDKQAGSNVDKLILQCSSQCLIFSQVFTPMETYPYVQIVITGAE